MSDAGVEPAFDEVCDTHVWRTLAPYHSISLIGIIKIKIFVYLINFYSSKGITKYLVSSLVVPDFLTLKNFNAGLSALRIFTC